MYRQNSVNAPRFTNEPSITIGCTPPKNVIVYSNSLEIQQKQENIDDHLPSPIINDTQKQLSTNLLVHQDSHHPSIDIKTVENIWIIELKQILNLSWPVSTSTIAQIAMYNIDTAFLGHLGTDELSGASLASMVAELSSTFLYAPAYGLNSLCSQAIGAGNTKLTGNWLQLSIMIATIMCIPTIILLFNVRSILSIVESDDNVLHYAQIFGRYGSLYIWPSVLYMALLQYFQALEIVKPATIISFICIAANIALNKILIYGIGDWNGLGFEGSPLATTLSTVSQLVLFWIWCIMIKKYHIKSGAWNGFSCKSFKKDKIVTFMKIIGPLTLGDASENWAYQIVSLWCAQLRPQDVGAMAVLVNIWTMLWAIFWGIGLATVIRSGKAVGNGDIKRLKIIMKISLFLTIICCAIISVLVFILRKNIAQIFSNEDIVTNILEDALPIIALNFFIEGIGWPACAILEGMSRNTIRAIVYTSSSWLLFVPLAVYFGIYSDLQKNHPNYAITMIWSAALVVAIVRVTIIWIVLITTNWRKECMKAQETHKMMKQNSLKLLQGLED